LNEEDEIIFESDDEEFEEEKEVKPALPSLTTSELLGQRQAKLEKCKQKLAVLAQIIMENPEENVFQLSFM
jgi:hypothetical protein